MHRTLSKLIIVLAVTLSAVTMSEKSHAQWAKKISPIASSTDKEQINQALYDLKTQEGLTKTPSPVYSDQIVVSLDNGFHSNRHGINMIAKPNSVNSCCGDGPSASWTYQPDGWFRFWFEPEAQKAYVVDCEMTISPAGRDFEADIWQTSPHSAQAVWSMTIAKEAPSNHMVFPIYSESDDIIFISIAPENAGSAIWKWLNCTIVPAQ